MTRQLISSGSEYEAKFGYSRAVVEGDWVFVSGTTGLNYATGEISDDPAEQTRQTLRTISDALEQGGALMADVVRARYYVPNVEDWESISEVLGEVFGDIRPAATAVIADLIDPRMKVEIEVTARKAGDA
ncbi:RidA family protein [Rhodospirillales bacterium]|nr:RidA family protein [Rhodospirillales bacterium]